MERIIGRRYDIHLSELFLLPGSGIAYLGYEQRAIDGRHVRQYSKFQWRFIPLECITCSFDEETISTGNIVQWRFVSLGCSQLDGHDANGICL